jgi:hypothetical protein
MGMWKRSGKRSGTNDKFGHKEKQQAGAKTKSEECEDETEKPVHASMRKWKVKDQEREKEAEKRAEQAALS